jgi:pimeloyl-ACP methyl ester carboxylesterase
MIGMLTSIRRLDLRPAYQALSCPAIVTLGRPSAEDDPDSPFLDLLRAYDVGLPAQLDQMAAANPSIRIVRFPDLGHMLHLEAPDRIAALISSLVTDER